MPVRFLSSHVLKWPDSAEVAASVGRWAARAAQKHPELVRLGYFGSYARGDWGVGSDLDLVAVVEQSWEPFERRALTWDLDDLPVPAELMVYTGEEWERLRADSHKFARTLTAETVWVYCG